MVANRPDESARDPRGLHPRLRAVADLHVDEVREYAGLHEYDGVLADLSPAGVRTALARLGKGGRLEDDHDEAQLAAFEAGARTRFGDLLIHRSNPLVHIRNLDLSCYDREYAPQGERQAARSAHLADWPDAVDAAIESLDRVPKAVATGLLRPAKGLMAALDPAEDPAAAAAHQRLIDHLEGAAATGDPDPAMGAVELARLMGDAEATTVDLGELGERADRERDRLMDGLRDACNRYRRGAVPAELLPELLADHPEPEGIYAEARAQIVEATRFTVTKGLLPDLGGECRVGPAPPARSWAMAMMSWAAPFEDDAPSWYYVTPPDPSWPREAAEQWLQVFSATTLPAITVHEVTPGHFAHGRMVRRLTSDVRRTLFSETFVEGWAHYVEELFVEEGFRVEDPRFAIGVYLEALLRVTRLAAAIGIHSREMTMAEAVTRFKQDAFLEGPAAESEAVRGTFDPTYGRYTWGKLEILALRDRARTQWGTSYSHGRFHAAMLELGAPAIGLLNRSVSG